MTRTPGTRILLVEDEAVIAREARLQLARAGYVCAAATERGEDAITLAGELRPDLVLMDIQLAGALDGIAAAAEIRELHRIPVIFLTSFTDETVLERAQRAEPFGYIVKPLDAQKLQPAVEIALHKHRAEARLRRSEERFRRLFNGARDAILLAEAGTGRIIEANDEACHLFACERDTLIGRHQSDLHPAEKAEDYRAMFQQIAETDPVGARPAEIVTGDGRVVPVEITASRIDLEDRTAVLGIFRDVSARRTAELAIRERQAHLDAIFRGVPAGIGVVRDRVIIEVNDHVSRMSGYTRAELVGRSTQILYATDADFARVGREANALRGTNATGTVEALWRHKDGRLIDVLVSSTAIAPGHGTGEFTFVAVDITEQKRIKAELALRNRTLEGMQHISQLMLDAAVDDEAFAAVAGEVAAMHGTRFAAVLLHHPDQDALQVAGAHDISGQEAFASSVPVPGTAAGRVFERAATLVEIARDHERDTGGAELAPFHARTFAGTPLIVGGGVVGVLAIAHDAPRAIDAALLEQFESVADHLSGLLEQREARAAQMRSETELLAIYDHAPVIICMLDEQMRIVRANQAAARLAGRRPTELHGARGGDLLSCLNAVEDPRGCGHGPHCATCTSRLTILDTLRTGRSHAQVEISNPVHERLQTRATHMLLSTARIDLDGRRRILVVLEDITQNRRLTEQLMRAQRMESIGTLASGIAHDLNNVLAPIVMCLSMLRDSLSEPATRDMVNTMQLAANRGADIVRQVLTFARGLGGDRVEIQPKHAIQETARIARETFPRFIDVVCDYGHGLHTILGDPTQIQQILMNLCVNARDAMPSGGQLIIHAENTSGVPDDVLPALKQREGRFVRISVKDTGTGMPPEVRERIFDPFFTTKPAGKGTGLGLAVSLGILERHGGAIRVATAPGLGTTFEVYLPAAEGAATPASPAPEETNLPAGNQELILVVDDEPGIRTALSSMLEKSGYRPVSARDGAEALEHLAEHRDPVHLVITDVMMPGVDGLEVLTRARALDPRLPLIAMTGLGEEDVRPEAKARGADRLLAKPFSQETLLRAVHELLATRSRHA